MIKVAGIQKSYGRVEVLKGVDLTISDGEIVSIVGASGAGKTTLLQIIGTLDKPDAGQVMYDDVDLFKLNSRDLSTFRNRNIGFIFQFHHLLPEFTALENVCMPAFIAGTSRRKAEARAKELLEFLNLGHRQQHKPAAMSGGEQQRVAVARALMNEPKVVLADEPSGNLDTENASELHDLFFQLRDEFNQTFIIVTHNQTLAEAADRVIEMKDGALKKS
ncbi:MAG: ABC transporter ATP-binding protein [Flavobacteriales bacterium]|nr:ABC transporter ATP-binding protein [Bacteroidota bacterium]MCB9239797.1 ABC transporter ATP-binding protein [Flavobacteriales bacterium]